MKKQRYLYIRGFTLIELVISIAVLSILTGLVLAILDPFSQFQKANDAKRKEDLVQVQRAMEQYYQDFGQYPKNSGPLIVDFKGNLLSWGSSWQPYINVLPKDPKPSNTYVYYVSADHQSYWLYASLERNSDPQACNKGSACASLSKNNLSNNACGGICNFAVSSPNVSP